MNSIIFSLLLAIAAGVADDCKNISSTIFLEPPKELKEQPFFNNNLEILTTCRPLLFDAGYDWQPKISHHIEYEELGRRIFCFNSYKITCCKWPEDGYWIYILNTKIHDQKYHGKRPDDFFKEILFTKLIAMQKNGHDWSNAPLRMKTVGKDLYEFEKKDGSEFAHISIQGDHMIIKMIIWENKIFSDEEKAFWRGIFEKTPAKGI